MPLKTQKQNLAILALSILLLASLSLLSYYVFFQQPGQACSGTGYSLTPVFTSPAAKMAELSSQNFTLLLFSEAASMEPLLNKSGTHAHMGFWSGPGNHGSLARLLDAINSYSPAQGEPPQKAIWDEGVQSSLQYPSYVEMNAQEHWYERASEKGGIATIYGVEYADPYPVAFSDADAVWAEYSERYIDMAVLIENATGNPVEVWCFVQGAKPNRIFYTYEYPELIKLEQQGIVRVHFAKVPDADWKDPEDWYEGTANAPLFLNSSSK